MAEAMRLDCFLWWVRLTRTRPAAQALATTGRLRIDGRPVSRAHQPVRIGNIVTFFADDRVRVVRIEALPTRRGPAPEARACYQDLAVANVSQDAAPD